MSYFDFPAWVNQFEKLAGKPTPDQVKAMDETIPCDPVPQLTPPAKRPGRPKGSKNKETK